MKKYIVAIVFIFILILIILGIRGCEDMKKPGGGDPYYEPFINASVEYICTIATDLSLNEDSEEAKIILNDIYAKYGLPVDDNEVMIEIYKKYENNELITQTITENLNNCSDFN